MHRAVSAPGAITSTLPEDWPPKAEMYEASEIIPEVPIQWFRTNVLPPLPAALAQDDLAPVVDELTRKGLLKAPGIWTKFDVEPQHQRGAGYPAAAALMEVISDIGSAARAVAPGVKQVVEFRANPEMTLMAKHRCDTSRSDGYGVYKGHRCMAGAGLGGAKRTGWEVVVAPGEYTKFHTMDTRNDNVRKILWSFTQIMRTDVRRRFVVGYTIENDFMRLWFCSRADLFVTTGFDVMMDPHIVAHFFLSQMYASESQLGYDTTIRYPADVSLHGKQWDIDVRVWVPRCAALSDSTKGKGKEKADDDQRKDECDEKQGCWVTNTYRTSKVLSDVGAQSLRGKGTRIWAVSRLITVKNPDNMGSRLVPEKKTVVLKDSWVDDDRKREGAIIQQILENAADDVKPKLHKYLLTVLCYGDVPFDRSLPRSKDTTAQMRSGQSIPKGRKFILEIWPIVGSDETEIESVRPSFRLPPRRPKIVVFDAKCHHRTVFEEVGKPIETLVSVHKIFNILGHATHALSAIHACGWVHRDISPGNLLIVDDMVKIIDLEYAVRLSDRESDTAGIGTPGYMAIAVEKHHYMSPLDFFDDEIEDKHLYVYRFYRNRLHDLESLWWSAMRLALYRVVAYKLNPDTTEAVRLARKQLGFYGQFFHGQRDRWLCIAVAHQFDEGKAEAHPLLVPVHMCLEHAREMLKLAYGDPDTDERSAGIKTDDSETAAAGFLESFMGGENYYEGDDDVELESICGAKDSEKDTPEEHAALPWTMSLGSRLETALPMQAGQEDVAHDFIRGFKREVPRTNMNDPQA